MTVRKTLSTTEMKVRASSFIIKWKDESREHAEAQSWWNDFFEVFGVDRYSSAVFERWARRASTGNQGRIDVFMPGVMIAEHKSLGRDVAKATSQAEDYLAGGDISAAEMPRYIVSTDFATVQITDLHSPLDPPFSFPIAKLKRHISRFAFLSGYHAPVRAIDQTDISIKAARKMGDLYESLLGGVDAATDDRAAEHAAVFMTRLLFLMYGDDTGDLWDEDAFLRFIQECTAEDGSDTGAQISTLFQVLDRPKDKRSGRLDDRLALFPHVNGGIFHGAYDIPIFDRAMRTALIDAAKFDWADVSPAIFGSLFQGLSSRVARREHGEHYTSETNIMKVLRPLFLDNLENELQKAWPSEQALVALHATLSDYRYLDPACGSGNFLIVAYREMRDFERRTLLRIDELRGTKDTSLDNTIGLRVSPDQFAGIELNWWPAKIAETAMFLVDHQANQRMAETLGPAPKRLPITVAAKIVHHNALTLDWSAVMPAAARTYVFGNPPFVGQYSKSDDQTADIKLAWGKDYDGYLDFVTAWHGKVLDYLAGTKASAFAFVTTNSIVQGQPVSALFRPIFRDGWRIAFAHRTFAWQSEATGAAHVHCVIVGFDKVGTAPRLFDYATLRGLPEEIAAIHVNPYLLDAPDVFITSRKHPLSPVLTEVTKGSSPLNTADLVFGNDLYDEVMADPVAAKYVRPFVGAKEFINQVSRWCFWMEDLAPADVAKSAILRTRIRAIEQSRKSSTRPQTLIAARTPHLFGERRQPKVPYLCIPRHYAYARPYMTVGRIQPDVIVSDANFSAEDPDGLLFAVISSSMFMAWQRMVGGRIKSDPRFANTVTWNTFPFPAVDDIERARLVVAGAAVLKARELQPPRNLAEMYNPFAMAPDLLKAHDQLDKSVDRTFGFSKTPTEGARQQRLFERYIELSEAHKLSVETEPKRKKRKSAD